MDPWRWQRLLFVNEGHDWDPPPPARPDVDWQSDRGNLLTPFPGESDVLASAPVARVVDWEIVDGKQRVRREFEPAPGEMTSCRLVVTSARTAIAYTDARKLKSDRRWAKFNSTIDRIEHVVAPTTWLQDKFHDKAMGTLGYEQVDHDALSATRVSSQVLHPCVFRIQYGQRPGRLQVPILRLVVASKHVNDSTLMHGIDYSLAGGNERKLFDLVGVLRRAIIDSMLSRHDITPEERAKVEAAARVPAPSLTKDGKMTRIEMTGVARLMSSWVLDRVASGTWDTPAAT